MKRKDMLIRIRKDRKNVSSALRGEKGFTLIELLIVIAIIGILAAIALPNLLSRRQAAIEDNLVNFDPTIYGVRVFIPYRSTWGIFWLGKNWLFINQSGRIIGILRPPRS